MNEGELTLLKIPLLLLIFFYIYHGDILSHCFCPR